MKKKTTLLYAALLMISSFVSLQPGLAQQMGKPAQKKRFGFSFRKKKLAFSHADFVSFKHRFATALNKYLAEHPDGIQNADPVPDDLQALYDMISEQFTTLIDSLIRVKPELKSKIKTLFERIRLYGVLRPILIEKTIDFLATYTEKGQRIEKAARLRADVLTMKTRLMSAATNHNMPNIKDVHDLIIDLTTLLSSVVVSALTRSALGTVRAYLGLAGMTGLPLGLMLGAYAFWKRKEIADYTTGKIVQPLKEYLEKEGISDAAIRYTEEGHIRKATTDALSGAREDARKERLELKAEIDKLEAKPDKTSHEKDRLEEAREEYRKITTPTPERITRVVIQDVWKQATEDPAGLAEKVSKAMRSWRKAEEAAQTKTGD